MLVQVKRHWFTEKTSIGLVIVDGVHFCFSLEDVARADGVKIPKVTAIPAGEYDLTVDDSERFKRPMPHILDVPRFDGIRIHWGNRPEDTEGCPILGYEKNLDVVWNSVKAFDDFFAKLDAAIKRGEKCKIRITNEQL